MRASAWLLVLACLGSLGCVVSTGPTGAEQVETKVIEATKAEMVNVELTLGAGEIQMSGGSEKLMEGRFTYSGDKWKPVVSFEESTLRGVLTVKHGSVTTQIGENVRNKWDLKLSDKVQMDLKVTLGAGEGRLELGSLMLRSAEVKLGAGKVELDLRGPKRKSTDVVVTGGVGEATVWVPNDVGVVAEAKGGIGEINVRGLRKDGGRWVNDNYGKSPVTLKLEVKGGIGQINIRAE